MSERRADVLIVEDDEPTQLFLQAICRRLRYTCICDGDGEAAKAHLDGSLAWKVVLLDLYLPKCSGFEVIEFVEKNAEHLLRRIIVVTAASERDVESVRDRGLVHSVLRKPIDIHDLTARMKACSSAKSMRKSH